MLSWRMDLSPLPICKVLLVAALFACLTMRPASARTLAIWAQLGPDNEQHREPNLVIRAITDGDECPVLRASIRGLRSVARWTLDVAPEYYSCALRGIPCRPYTTPVLVEANEIQSSAAY